MYSSFHHRLYRFSNLRVHLPVSIHIHSMPGQNLLYHSPWFSAQRCLCNDAQAENGASLRCFFTAHAHHPYPPKRNVELKSRYICHFPRAEVRFVDGGLGTRPRRSQLRRRGSRLVEGSYIFENSATFVCKGFDWVFVFGDYRQCGVVIAVVEILHLAPKFNRRGSWILHSYADSSYRHLQQHRAYRRILCLCKQTF